MRNNNNIDLGIPGVPSIPPWLVGAGLLAVLLILWKGGILSGVGRLLGGVTRATDSAANLVGTTTDAAGKLVNTVTGAVTGMIQLVNPADRNSKVREGLRWLDPTHGQSGVSKLVLNPVKKAALAPVKAVGNLFKKVF